MPCHGDESLLGIKIRTGWSGFMQKCKHVWPVERKLDFFQIRVLLPNIMDFEKLYLFIIYLC